jgi:hypothetical protein
MAMAYRWHIYKMITRERAEIVARELALAVEIPRDGDCLAEVGREGLPCRLCARNRMEWRAAVGRVRLALKKAFS